jgi:NAD(P)-dependent dehydrogenase (short-subunit alcohol dehydrogenase family)
MRLENKVAVVTGAGSGIGRAIASRFATEGAFVVLADVNDFTCRETGEIIRAMGYSARAVTTDVSKADSVSALFKELDDLLLIPEILVNNAGNTSPLIPVHETTDQAWDAIIKVHLYGTFHCTRGALPRMIPRSRGVVINMSSVAGLRGLACGAASSAAKGAIIALTKGVAQEVAHVGIRVNCIAPGWIDTPILKVLPGRMQEEITATVPMGRLGTAQETASLAVFLASNGSGYLTGQVISPNGALYT